MVYIRVVALTYIDLFIFFSYKFPRIQIPMGALLTYQLQPLHNLHAGHADWNIRFWETENLDRYVKAP